MKKISYIVLSLMLVSSMAEAQRTNQGRAGVGRAGVIRNPIKVGSPTVAVATQTVQPEETITIIETVDVTTTANALIEKAKLEELSQKQALRDQLKLEISQIEGEQKRCDKQKKTWTALTIAGSVGTVAGATGAIIQGKDLKEKKEDLKDLQDTSK